MKNVIIIPARYKSTRFPGKPLVELKNGAGVVAPLIWHTWQKAMTVKGIDRVIIATDDQRIADISTAFGAEVVLTSPECRNGTERCAEAINSLGITPEVVVNFQGDAPLTPPNFIESLIAHLENDQEADVATPVLLCESNTIERFKEDRKAGKVGGTTAVFDTTGRALYFSKEIIPYHDSEKLLTEIPVYHHVGVYAYRPSALNRYNTLEEGTIERLEGLEQLRFLENKIPVSCVIVTDKSNQFWEVNNPWDIERVETSL